MATAASPDVTARPTGIEAIGSVAWGTHFCQFYATRDDLSDVLVPYFKAGLENGERCMWVTSQPLGVEEAWESLARAMPDLDDYRRRGRIDIVPHTEWYLRDGHFDKDRVLQAWIDELDAALSNGLAGLRLSGNTFWLEQSNWNSFAEYEAAVDDAIVGRKMLALCTYSLDRCGASEVVDVVRNHQFALLKRGGAWELIESFERRRMREAHARERERLLQEVDRRRTEFLAELSHELRNPLAPIRTSLEILESAPPGSEAARRAVDVIGRQTDQLARLVDDLLDVTRIGRGKIQLQPERLDLSGLVRRTVEDHRALFAGRGVELTAAIAAERMCLWADPTRITQVVGNLLGNAAKFTPAGGRVDLRLERAGADAVLTVRDTGAGIPQGNLARLFEPFEQGEGARDHSHGGLGLGLALVKGFVELHHGTVEAHSDGPGRGAVFTVRLPLERR